MTAQEQRDAQRIKARQAREDFNIFSRLPTVYAASRLQSQQLLHAGGELSIVEWRVLWDLSEVGPLSVRDLAAIQRADHSLISRALPAMRHKGLVQMTRDARDGRQMIVQIADAGRAAYAQAAPIMARRRAALRDTFTPDEIAAFVGYLDRLDGFFRSPIADILQKETSDE